MNHLYRPCMLIPWTKGITANIWHWSLTPDTHGVPILILSQTSAEQILCVFVVEFHSIGLKGQKRVQHQGFSSPISLCCGALFRGQPWHGKASWMTSTGVDTTKRCAKWLFKWDIVIHKSSNITSYKHKNG